MQLKKRYLGNILIFLLIFSSFVNLGFAGFQLGDSSLPVDEEEFIEYDFEDSLAPQTHKLKVEFIKLYQYEEIIRALGVNISVNKFNFNTSTYEILNIDAIEYQNQLCLLYNKTDQLFRYDQHMNNLLIHCFGGYYIIPDNPVDVNIVKGFIESYTTWSASVSDYTITIDIDNSQAILTYNKQGILIKEEIKINNEIISTLTLIESKENLNDIVFIISIIVVIAAATLISIIIIIIKRK
ncbi:MAG: hypothetical protein ACFFBC_09135 [Promethearchaeota archaeon]